MTSPYLDRLLRAAMTRRSLDTLALKALVKATHLLGLALAERLRQYRDSGDPVLDGPGSRADPARGPSRGGARDPGLPLEQGP